MVQRQSETVRRGNPPDHELAVEFVRRHLIYTKYETLFMKTNVPIIFPAEFIKKHVLEYNKHSFDFIAKGLIVEMDGDRDYAYPWVSGYKTKHSKKGQQINDGIIKSYVEEYFPNVKLLRLKKEEVNAISGPEYLTEQLA